MNARLAIYAGVAVVLLISWGAAFVIWRAAEMGDQVLIDFSGSVDGELFRHTTKLGGDDVEIGLARAGGE